MALKDGTDELLKVVHAIFMENSRDYIITYQHICEATGLELEEVKKLVNILKKLDYVSVTTGFDDEGLIRGRGFFFKRDKWAEVDVLCDLIEARGLV